MDNPIHTHLPNPNPVTTSRHRRQIWLQIILPVLVFAILVVVVAALATTGSTPQVTRWSNISAIIVILPFLIILLVTAVVTGLLVYGLARLLRVLPSYTHQAQIIIDRVGESLRGWSDRAAKPVIAPKSAWAGVKAAFSRLRI